MLEGFTFKCQGAVIESRKLEAKTGNQFAHLLKVGCGAFTQELKVAEPLWKKAKEIGVGQIVQCEGHRATNWKKELEDVATVVEVLDEAAMLRDRLAALTAGSKPAPVPSK
ncbi:MAG TPA: hypothetical protein VHN77_13350 [Phycisphaerales bacterium]|nr:hypothetical protein [Phycisphaerales bacterium]